MMSRFPVLTLMDKILRVVALICPVVGLILVSEIGIVGFIASLGIGLMIWVYAEISGVMLSIENNTFEAKNHLAVLAQSASVPRSNTSPSISPFATPITESYVPAPSRITPQPTAPTVVGDRILNLWPRFGKPGAQVTADVSGFPAGSVIQLNWYAHDGTVHTIGKINAGPQGSVTFPVSVPAMEKPGSRQVEAAASQGPKATMLFTVE